MNTPLRGFVALLTAAALQAAVTAQAAESNPVARAQHLATDATSLDVIVKLRAPASAGNSQKLATNADRSVALGKRTGLALEMKHEIAKQMLATHIELGRTGGDEALAALRADPEVEYVSIDRRRFPQAAPNDPLFAGQWYLKSTEVSAVNAIGAWDSELGSAGVVVAVLDTGILYDHPDLGRGDRGGRMLPGYDFVSGTASANDGDGRDADPSDPGDWVSSSDKSNSALSGCDLSDSSWHGSRVAGMIAALTNNGVGVSGMSWNSWVLPVRVLGKCGGIDSDILAGMRWAAGLHVDGVPDNPTPARILNMSLGSDGACDPPYRQVIDELTARKVLVVISAGNDGTVVASPANCPGVAAVAAIRHVGSKVGFSDLGPEVTIAAPGGNCVNTTGGPCLFSLDTTANSGTTTPGSFIYTDQNNPNLGTSFSAPIVSGIAALMLAHNYNLSTAQLLARLREGARPFPTTVSDDPAIQACHVPANDQDFQTAQCLCTTSVCGAGMADAAMSVSAAGRPIAAVSAPSSIFPGQNVSLNATGSAASCGHTVLSYSWTVTSPLSNPPAVSGANSANATVVAPIVTPIGLRLTVTDDQGRFDVADVVVEPGRVTSTAPATAGTTACAAVITSGPTPVATTPSPPSSSSSSSSGGKGGGGGSLGLVTVGLLGLLIICRRRVTARARFSRCI